MILFSYLFIFVSMEFSLLLSIICLGQISKGLGIFLLNLNLNCLINRYLLNEPNSLYNLNSLYIFIVNKRMRVETSKLLNTVVFLLIFLCLEIRKRMDEKDKIISNNFTLYISIPCSWCIEIYDAYFLRHFTCFNIK